MPGPPPKHPDARRRRNAGPQIRRLPSEGRKAKPPAWPLSPANNDEKRVWSQVWRTPQAVAWEELGWLRTVGRYVRMLVASEERGALVSLCSEVRQMEDRLGLHPLAMLRLRWEIAADEVAARRETSNVRRLKAVDPAATG